MSARGDQTRQEIRDKVIQKNGGVYERSFPYENEMADIYKIVL